MWKWILGVPIVLFVLVMFIGYAHEQTPEGKAYAHKREIAQFCEREKDKQVVTDTQYQVNCDAFAEEIVAHEQPNTGVPDFTGNMEVQAPPTHYERMKQDDPHFDISAVTHKQWQAKCRTYLKYDEGLTAKERKQMPTCEQEWKQLTAAK
ncbi:hypothetical protein [Paraburkholderia sp. C35]|uniref:hypothetical protein n=1 Tax=Paraburkholderia sp. C35 TaxID=2126993 RepID=UPI000D68C7A1|nr:hypothetical protein [Paraburkholderia sp. C35]